MWVEFVVGPCLALFFCRFAFLFPTTKTLQFPIWPQSMSTSSWKINESIMITLHFTLPECFTHNISYSMGTCVTTVTPRFKLTVESSYKVSALQHVHENHRNHWTFFSLQSNCHNGLSSPGVDRKFSLWFFSPRGFEFNSCVASPVAPGRDSNDRCLQIQMQGRSLGSTPN